MAAPTIQAESIVVTNITADSCSISCTAGDGAFRTIWVGEGTTGDLFEQLSDATTYVADDRFNGGDQVNGFSCVYNGPDTAVDITALSSTPEYNFRVVVCEYNGGAGSEEYNTTTAKGNPANFTKVQPGQMMRFRRVRAMRARGRRR